MINETSMKVLGIVGSRRKSGNTAVLVKTALQAIESDNINTQLIFLEDYDIKGCSGCEGCHDSFECVQNDDMQKLYPRLLEADAIVIGSPTHFYNISSSINAFLERCYCFEIFDSEDRSVWLSLNEILGLKYAVVIAVCEQQTKEDMGFTAEAMSLTLEALGYRVVEQVKTLRLFEKGAALEDKEAINQVQKAGQKLAKTLMLRKKVEKKLNIK